MSSLFHLQLTSIDGDTVRVHFGVIHPDQWDVPMSKNIALQTIVEAYWIQKMGYAFGSQPVTDERYKELAKNSPVVEKLEELLEYAHGRKVEIDESEYDALSRGENTDGLSGWGMSDGQHYKNYPTDYNAFCIEAETLIGSVRLENEDGNPKSNIDDPDPMADLVFTVTDSRFLEHMVEDEHWESAMYCFEYYRTVWSQEIVSGAPNLSVVSRTLKPFDAPAEEGTPECFRFGAANTSFASSQASEVVAYDADQNETWRKKTPPLFMQLHVSNDYIQLYDKYMEGDSFAFSLDGEPLEKSHPGGSVVSNSGAMKAWFGEDNRLRFHDDRTLEYSGTVEAAAFSPDETMMAVGGMFDQIHIVDIDSGESTLTFDVDGRVGHLAFSPNGTFISASVDFNSIQIFRVSDGALITTLRTRDYLNASCWSRDQTMFAVVHVGGGQGYGGFVTLHPVYD